MFVQKLYEINPNPAQRDAIVMIRLMESRCNSLPMIGLVIATVNALIVNKSENEVFENPNSVVTGVMNKVCMLLTILNGNAINKKQAAKIVYL